MSGHFHYGGDEYCEMCLPVPENDPGVDIDHGEQDYVAHCCQCHRMLDCSLTSGGVRHVIESLAEALSNEEWKSREVRDNSHLTGEDYYKGLPHWAVLMDWAEHIQHYAGLDTNEQGILRAFLELFGAAKEAARFADRTDYTAYTYHFVHVDREGEDAVHTVSTPKRLDDYAAWVMGEKLTKQFGWTKVSLIQETITQTGYIKHAFKGTLAY